MASSFAVNKKVCLSLPTSVEVVRFTNMAHFMRDAITNKNALHRKSMRKIHNWLTNQDDELRSEHEQLARELEELAEEYKAIREILDRLRDDYAHSKQHLLPNRYFELKAIIKRAVMHLKLIEQQHVQKTLSTVSEGVSDAAEGAVSMTLTGSSCGVGNGSGQGIGAGLGDCTSPTATGLTPGHALVYANFRTPGHQPLKNTASSPVRQSATANALVVGDTSLARKATTKRSEAQRKRDLRRECLCDEELKAENAELRALIDECRDSTRTLKSLLETLGGEYEDGKQLLVPQRYQQLKLVLRRLLSDERVAESGSLVPRLTRAITQLGGGTGAPPSSPARATGAAAGTGAAATATGTANQGLSQGVASAGSHMTHFREDGQ